MSDGVEETADGRVPVVSVVCPCLNSADTLAVQLDALSAQACDVPWEMIVVDDGSTDGTQALAWSYCDRLPQLRVLETDVVRSQGDGVNAAVRAARGRHIVVVHGDDEVAPGYLQAMHLALEEHPVVGAVLDHEALNPPWTRVVHAPMQVDELSVINDFLPVIVGAALGIRKEVFEAVGGFDPASDPLIDVDLSWRLQLAGYPLTLARDAVLRYRYRDGFRSTYRQKRNYATADVYLALRYFGAGAPRRGMRTALDGWYHVFRTFLQIRDRRSAMLFADLLGGAVGRLRGSVRYGYLNL